MNETESDFATAWGRSLAGVVPAKPPLDPKLLDYQMVGRQGKALEQLLQCLPRERLLLLVFDEIVSNPHSVWTEVTAFLDIDRDPEPEFRAENASNRTSRWPAFRHFVHRPPRVLDAPVSFARRAFGQSRIPIVQRLRRSFWKEAPRPTIDLETRRSLVEFFRDDVMVVERVLGRELGWR